MKAQTAIAPQLSSEEINRRAIARRGVEAAIWGMPIVSVDAMRRAFFSTGAKYGDIAYFSKPADWKFQITTPNSSSLYVYFNFNTKDGPVVLDFPAAAGAGLFGSILDAWQVPLTDAGPEGEDGGKGGKYLITPPGYTQDLPSGYIPVRAETYNGYAVFRAIPATSSDADRAKAIDLVKQLRLYPLAKAARPPAPKFIDIAGKAFEAIASFDDTFFDSLARMVNEEPVHERDLVAMAQLRSLGIEKGKDFNPDQATRDRLKEAIAEAHAGFMLASANITPWWPDSSWGMSIAIGPKTKFTYRLPDRLEIDERGATFFLACAAPKKLGAATFYLGAFVDADRKPLQGSESYRLRIPPKAPVKQYWAVTVYDLETAAFVREAPRLSVDSYQDVQKNADGSVDVYFSETPPAGKESNWIYTAPGKRWFAFFRFYGPEKAVFSKMWALPDIEKIS